MKPVTKREKLVAKLSAQLPHITDSQREWAVQHIGHAVAYSNKRFTWCSECGQLFKFNKAEYLVDVINDGNKVTCPHCGKVLELKEGMYGKFHEDKYYYTIITTMKGFQVFRHFLVDKFCKRGEKSSHIIYEVVQNWVNKDGKETIMARDIAPLCYYRDNWLLNKGMSIKRTSSGYYYVNNYDIDAYFVYPRKRFIPQMKRNGFTGDFLNLPPNVFSRNLLGCNEYEYLLKTNQKSVFYHLANRCDKTIPYKYAINICHRNNYIIEDANLWFDMLQTLSALGKDLHNPHYICPANLRMAHDEWMNELRKKREKEDRERMKKEMAERLAEALKWEKKYREAKQKFFDLVISNDNIIVEVLKSIKEFEEEGKAMHHCVFTNEYYKNNDCLILSAKDNEGNRIETIEINLTTFKIIQSRGVCNKFTERHEEIMNLVNLNMTKIQMLAASA